MDLNITSYKRRLCININSFESRLNIELARFLWLSLTCRRAQKKSLENKRKKSNFFIRIINLKNDFLSAAPFVNLSRSKQFVERLNYWKYYIFPSVKKSDNINLKKSRFKEIIGLLIKSCKKRNPFIEFTKKIVYDALWFWIGLVDA